MGLCFFENGMRKWLLSLYLNEYCIVIAFAFGVSEVGFRDIGFRNSEFLKRRRLEELKRVNLLLRCLQLNFWDFIKICWVLCLIYALLGKVAEWIKLNSMWFLNLMFLLFRSLIHINWLSTHYNFLYKELIVWFDMVAWNVIQLTTSCIVCWWWIWWCSWMVIT